MQFPVDLSLYKPCPLDPAQASLTDEQKTLLTANIALLRDAIVFMTALSNCKGVGGHTGGAYDIVPEVLIVEGLIEGGANIFPVHFDDAGHRVAIQYVLAAIKGHIPVDKLLTYREYASDLPGHPELDITPGIEFSSGRLGHMWSYVNGLALAHPDKQFVLYSSDGAQQEGNSAEAARFAVSQKLNVKVIVDDNDVTIAGYPSEYMPGFDVEKTLAGHGLEANSGDGENIDQLFTRIVAAFKTDGPVGVVNKRKMAPGIPDVEGTEVGHDAVPKGAALKYFTMRNNDVAAGMIEKQESVLKRPEYAGSTRDHGSKRKTFGRVLCELITEIPAEERRDKIRVVDSDLSASCGLSEVLKQFPDLYIQSGIMERNNYGVAAGFGSRPGTQGVFGTFAAFQEMIISEIVMARLNHANVLVHLSHSGVDDMSDNTCHFGINNSFADNSLPEGDMTRLYFPADALQMEAITRKVFHDPGLRFIYSTRSSVPWILNDAGEEFFDPARYTFTGNDEVICEGTDGYLVSYGEMLYRTRHAVALLKEKGFSVGLINKPCMNVPDEAMLAKLGKAGFVMVAESQNRSTGLGMRMGSWFLERGYHPVYAFNGSVRPGNCGMSEQIDFQDLNPEAICEEFAALLK